MTRERLPNRRPSDVFGMEFGDKHYEVGVGFYDDGRPGEVFVKGAKTGSDLDALFDDASVLLSFLLQHGILPAAIAKSMGRVDEPAGAAASAIGAVADLLAGVGRWGQNVSESKAHEGGAA